MKLLAGIPRKLSIPFVVLCILGWLLFVIGFALYNFSEPYEDLQDDNGSTYPDHRADLNYFPYWCFIVAGPVLFINLILHLIIGRWFTGIFTHFLVALYLVVGGGILYMNGRAVFSEDNYDKDHITDKGMLLYPLIEWIGCMASVLGLTAHMMMWPLFFEPKEDNYT